MKVLLSWLRDYVPVTLPVPELAERLTLAGLEVAGLRFIGLPVPPGVNVPPEEVGPVWDRDKVFIVQVQKTEKHPNADKLRLVTVELGNGQSKVVLTGAPNIAPGDSGMKAILALQGSVLFDGHSDKKVLKELKPATIRGTLSDSMLCSAYELGISDEHEGIILLDPSTPPVGTPLADVMGDVVLDLDVLPNMARALSMIGVAREVAALTGQTISRPDLSLTESGEPAAQAVAVQIDDPRLSARYAARLIRGVTIGPSPDWMQRRLDYAGMRPINNIVDITNYVMLEWGQPLHAFDHDVLVKRAGGKAPTIIVRPAREGETLKTLDNVERKLTPEMLVIADTTGPVALGGVMGGLETEVSPATKNVLLESASFNFVSIRRTMKALNLPSEASVRFSKGIHPETVRPAADRAAQHMQKHAGGSVAPGVVDAYPAPMALPIIELSMAEVRRILGMDFPIDEAERILRALEFTVERAGPAALRVTAPPHRLDIQAGPADLIEDLARIHGYDRLPATLLAAPLPEQRGNPDLAREERVRDLLVDAGLQEVITYALTSPEREALLAAPSGEHVRLLNPISSDRVVMRRALLPGVLEVAASNLKETDTVKLFEVGAVYLPRPGEKLPAEPRRLAVVLSGRREPAFWADPLGAEPPALDFFDLKGILESLAADLHLPPLTVRVAAVSYLHPGRSAELQIGGEPVGTFGQLHPKAAKAFDLGGKPVLVAELDLETILAKVPDRYEYTPVPRFPAALRDIAVIVPEATPAEQVVGELRTSGGPLLRDARLFDVYRGSSIPEGTKSLAYALTYQAEDRTLTDKEVDAAHQRIENRLKHVLKAQIRGKEAVGK
jgi:phenylalanyl-tRNA synthetase beta chain